MYVNIFDYISEDYVFNFFVGGRGIGKTYSVLKEIYEREIPFLYLRYSSVEVDISVAADLFKQYGDDITYDSKDGVYIFYKGEDEDKRRIGYAASLSTFKTKRGVDFSDVQLIFFDEFIPEIGSRQLIKYPGDSFLNLYETVNRNREFSNKKPVMVICCANSNNIANPLMQDLKLTTIAEDLMREEKEFYHNKDRSLQLALLKSDPDFLAKKQETVLYKFATGDFTEMALNNLFAYNDFSNVKNIDLKGYKPIMCVKNHFTVYQKKGEKQFLCYPHDNTQVPIFDLDSDIEKQEMKRRYFIYFNAQYYKNNFRFTTYDVKNTFINNFILKR